MDTNATQGGARFVSGVAIPIQRGVRAKPPRSDCPSGGLALCHPRADLRHKRNMATIKHPVRPKQRHPTSSRCAANVQLINGRFEPNLPIDQGAANGSFRCRLAFSHSLDAPPNEPKKQRQQSQD